MDYKDLVNIASRFKNEEIDNVGQSTDGITDAIVDLVKEIALKTVNDFLVFVKEATDDLQ